MVKGNVLIYKKSIYEVGISDEKQALIWDFYVTHSFASSASQKRAVKDYGLNQLPLKEMLKAASITEENSKILPCSSLKNTLLSLNLDTNNEINFETPRLCCLQPFKVDESLKIIPLCSQAECLFTHIRNAFAHGNTFFLDNGNVLFEDKDRQKVTARIFIAVDTLIQWIIMIDKNHFIYSDFSRWKKI